METQRPKKRGRKTRYTPETVERITDALRRGMTHKLACAAARIHVDTFYTWIAQYPEFSEAVKKAEADFAQKNLAIIQDAADNGSWQASAWLLERRHPEDYRQRQETTLHGALSLDRIRAMSDEELAEELRRRGLGDA